MDSTKQPTAPSLPKLSLKKGRVAIPLSKGLNQKVDPKQDPPGSLNILENVQVSKYGEIEKRDGYEKIQDRYGYTSTLDTSEIKNLQAIASFKNDLYILSDGKAFTNREELGKGIYEGAYLPVKIRSEPLTQPGGYETTNLNTVVKGNFAYSVYSTITGAFQFPALSVKNLNTDTWFVLDQTIFGGTASVFKPKVISIGDKIAKFGIEKDGTDYYIVYNLASPTDHGELTSASFTRLLQTHSDQIYDVVGNVSGTAAMVAHKKVSTEECQAVSVFLDNDPAVGDVLNYQSAFISTGTALICNALDLTPIPLKGEIDGVEAVGGDSGGFLLGYASTNSGSTTFNANIASFDEFGVNIHVNSNYGLSTQWALVLKPSAVTTIARHNNWGWGYNNPYAYELYVQYDLTATATGTDINKLYMKDNTTGTWATDDILASDFSSNWIKKSVNSTSAYTSVSYADFPNWNKKRIGLIRWNMTGTTGTLVGYIANYKNFKIGASLVSKPFLVSGDTILPVGRPANLTDSYYLISPRDYDTSSTQPVGLIQYGTASSEYAYGDSTHIGYPSVPSIGLFEGDTILPFLEKGRIESNDKSFFARSVPSLSRITHDANIANQNEEAGKGLHVAGGQLYSSDQVRFQEHGFLYPPSELYVHTQNMTSTSPIFSTGESYSYVACYKYDDQQGNIHRSGLSPQFSFQLGGNEAHIDVIIPMLNITSKWEPGTHIELYRTTNSGTIFYKVSDLNVSSTVYPSANDKSFNYIKIRDANTDLSIQDNELLYTTGGVLENTPIGSCRILESFKNRLFMAGVDRKPNLIYFSKFISSDGGPVEFSNLLSVEVAEAGGDVVALKKMDDKLIIFKERAIYLLTGEGPNNLGKQNDFIEPQLISSDLGCKFANGIAFIPKGLIFMSQKGIWLLTRSLNLEYVGAAAENYNHLTVTKATTVPKKDEVRFLTSDGATIIYNYYLNMWYTYSDHRGPTSHMIGDDYYLGDYKDKIYKQVGTTSSFGGAMVPIKLETGWLSFAGIQGYQRIYRMLLLGEYRSPHKLHIKVGYNYDDVWSEEKLIDVTGYTESYSYGAPTTGTADTYGDPSGGAGKPAAIAYGGKDNTQYQIRLNFKKQKCEAIRIQITEVEGSNSSGDADSAGPGFNLSNISFIVGLKDGDFRIKQGRTFGSTSIT